MLMKYLTSLSGRQSYSVGKVLVQSVKATESHVDNLHRRIYVVFPRCISGKAIVRGSLSKNAVLENPDNATQKAKEKKSPVSPTRRKVADEIYDYLSQSCSIDVLNTIPRRYFRRNSIPVDHIVLADTSIADVIMKCIENNVVKEGAIVLETNPGMGILSKKFIDAGVQQVHLYEPSPIFCKILKDFHDHDTDKVTLHSVDFLSLWKLTYQDKMDNGSRVDDLLSHYPKRSWMEDPLLKIVAVIQSSQFIKHLILSLVSQSGIMVHCRPELYILMPPILYVRLTCAGDAGYVLYRSISILFQLFFDHDLLEKVPRKAYLPWKIPKKKKRMLEIDSLSDEWLYLVRIVPKRDLYTTVVSSEKIRALWYFVRHHFWSRSRRLIPEMESWIPGCGARLILEGYDIFTEFGDLKPEEVLHIFQLFSSWPEYQDSSFLSSMETALLKLDETDPSNMKAEGTLEDKEEPSENVDKQI